MQRQIEKTNTNKIYKYAIFAKGRGSTEISPFNLFTPISPPKFIFRDLHCLLCQCLEPNKSKTMSDVFIFSTCSS